MNMRSGQQLLLPVNPAFIWVTLLVGLMITLTPIGRTPWMPDPLMVLVVFWGLQQPGRIGMGVAFVLGLCIDVQFGALLGQHALAYTLIVFTVQALQRRLLWLEAPGQALYLLPFFFGVEALEVAIRVVAGGVFPGFSTFIAPLVNTLLWPIASYLLLAPQRRPPDPDENRPL
jgi:rod shape-determining protein MreD